MAGSLNHLPGNPIHSDNYSTSAILHCMETAKQLRVGDDDEANADTHD
ncbi:hypothetical protein [Synechococcus sp. SYN20]|nr:hypothetical protein [Synechococcus sp. SYN20]